MSDNTQIKDQIKLPLRIAFGVVMQGVRIRFGRSVVTLTGVILGIAFLMSILTGLALKEGVSEEEVLRVEVRRMFSFLVAEMGPADGRTLGVITGTDLSAAEKRLLLKLEDEGLEKVLLYSSGAEQNKLFQNILPESVDRNDLGKGASAVLAVGKIDPSAYEWETVFKSSRQKVLAFSRIYEIENPGQGIILTILAREMTQEEIEAAAVEAKKSRFRNGWIIIISLLVTVMGITNAMLMSVTERFREIGTMKCLGALSSFVRTMFLIESLLVGSIGGIAGSITGMLFSTVAYGFTYGFALVFTSVASEAGMIAWYMFLSVVAGIFLSTVAAIYPAHVASRMVPADALRSNV